MELALRKRLYLSTIAADAAPLAAAEGLGLEIAEYCTAYNMDERLAETDALVREKMRSSDRFILHAPFNELFPAAVDPKAAELARYRYRQACALARGYGVRQVVAHGGFVPRQYFPDWFHARSVKFWRDVLAQQPGDLLLCLENVEEPHPFLLLDVVRAVDDPRLRLCLDVGHAHVFGSGTDMEQWLRVSAPLLAHVHVHNNDGLHDGHRPLPQGSIPLRAVLEQALELCPQATFTIETQQAESSLDWLAMQGLL